MKASKYNYIIEREDNAYWYNGIERKYFTLPVDISRKIETFINVPDKITLLPDVLAGKLASGGFIVPEETDEVEVIRKKMKRESIKKIIC